jgi:hypothetical protein
MQMAEDVEPLVARRTIESTHARRCAREGEGQNRRASPRPRVSPNEGGRPRLPAPATRKKSEPGRNKSAVRPKWLEGGRSLGASPRHFVVKHREQPILIGSTRRGTFIFACASSR